MEEYLELLEVEEHSNWSEIEQAYHDQLRVWNPDRFLTDSDLFARARARTRQVERAWIKLQSVRLKIEKVQGFNPSAPFIVQYKGCRSRVKGSGSLRRRGAAENPHLKDSLKQWESAASQMWSEPKSPRGKRRKPGKKRRSAKAEQPKERRRRSSRRQFTDLRRLLQLTPMVAFGLIVVVLLYETFSEGSTVPAPIVSIPVPAEKPVKPRTRAEAETQSTAKVVYHSEESARPELVSAAMECDLPRVQHLLQQGANPNVRDSQEETPLMWAAKTNCLAALETLLKAGADRTLKSKNGFTAMQWAAWYKHSKAEQRLAAR